MMVTKIKMKMKINIKMRMMDDEEKKQQLMNEFADNITQKLDFRSRTRDYYKIPC